MRSRMLVLSDFLNPPGSTIEVFTVQECRFFLGFRGLGINPKPYGGVLGLGSDAVPWLAMGPGDQCCEQPKALVQGALGLRVLGLGFGFRGLGA